ncbi:hypothetical protein BGX23_000435 [Mortierella sp. AD031]|nr:hypothetical protein BGX23_000435 [Mortierella sp. AD031]
MTAEDNHQATVSSTEAPEDGYIEDIAKLFHNLEQLQLEHKPAPPPLPLNRVRWFYEKNMSTSTEYEQAYYAVRRIRPPITIDSRTKYTKWNIPVPQLSKSYFDIVLGIKVKDLQLKYIEAVIVTIEQTIGRRLYYKAEVFTPQDLEQLCATTSTTPNSSRPKSVESEDGDIMKWKLKEQLLASEGLFHAAIEVKTWNGAPTNHGSIELYFVETHVDSRSVYQNDPFYREHQPCIFSIDVNNTGRPEIDSLAERPNFVDSYVFSREGAHLAVDVLSKSGRFVLLYQIRELSASDPRCITQFDTILSRTQEKQEDKRFSPMVVAWMYFSKKVEAQSVDLALSFDGTQLAVLDKVSSSPGGNVGGEGKDDYECCTAVYRYSPKSIGTGEFPPEATVGSGFVRVNVTETCPGLIGFAGRAEFHIVATKDQNLKDELLVACDGVTIDIYSVFGVWSHLRTIVLDPAPNDCVYRRNVFAALFKQLRGKYVILVDARGSKVTTWDIEKGIEVASSTMFSALEMWALSHIANVSRDGSLIAIPGKQHIGIYETTSWRVVGWYKFPDIAQREFVGEGQFIRNDTQFMVAIESDDQPFYRKNRGYVIDLATMAVVELYVSSGSDIFRALPTKDCREDQLILGIGNSSACAFRLEGRLLLAPRPSEDDDDLLFL